MDALLRHLRKGPDGIPEYHDTEVHAEALSIGSAADCNIQLLGEAVAPEHAVIRGAEGRFTITCRRGHRIALNGAPVSSGALRPGDRMEVAGHQLRCVAPPAGFEIALEIEPNAEIAAGAFERAFRTDLSETWLTRRLTSWLLTIAVLLIGLLIPLASISWHRAGHPTPPGIPDDTLWTAGPLTPAHQQAAGKKCASCHEQLFVHVRDSTCRECHRSTAAHVSPASLRKNTSLGPAQRCAQCHREHDEIVQHFVIRDNGLCADCHARSNTKFPALKVAQVTGFSRQKHPEFTVELFTPDLDRTGQFVTQWRSSRQKLPDAIERTNLKFSHEQHLDSNRVRRETDSGALNCGDCHPPASDGEHFLPVTMQRSCAACHDLRFDPAVPDRQLPHGKPRDSMLLIQDYFTRKFVDPSAASAALATVQRRRLPDQRIEEETCTGPAFACGLKRARAEIETQFTRRGCVSCHVVVDTQAAEILDRYQVTPIRLTFDYFPDVHFSHKQHAVQNDKSADEACLSCHGARTAKVDTPVMIPALPKCLKCHSEKAETDRVTLQCISCHAYHPASIIATNRKTRANEPRVVRSVSGEHVTGLAAINDGSPVHGHE